MDIQCHIERGPEIITDIAQRSRHSGRGREVLSKVLSQASTQCIQAGKPQSLGGAHHRGVACANLAGERRRRSDERFFTVLLEKLRHALFGWTDPIQASPQSIVERVG